MNQMQSLALVDGPVHFAGAVSLDVTAEGVAALRFVAAQRDLYEPALIEQARCPAGVRLTFVSDTSSVELGMATEAEGPADPPWVFDLVVDGGLHQRIAPPHDVGRITFTDLPEGERLIELYLPTQYAPVRVHGLAIDAGASAKPWTDPRPRWLAYGSSLTHCRHAAGPSECWPALVASRFGLNHVNLGYGGQEHLEPIMAETIGGLPLDYISLCCGGNVHAMGSYSGRTFRAAVIGFIRVIRRQQPRTPIVVCSCLWLERGGDANCHGLTLDDHAAMTRDAVEALTRCGDEHLLFQEGPAMFGPADRHLLADGVHPNAEGYRLVARRYGDIVMPRLGLRGDV